MGESTSVKAERQGRFLMTLQKHTVLFAVKSVALVNVMDELP